MHADPAGDCGAPILALDAELVIAGPGRRAHGGGGRLLRGPVRPPRWARTSCSPTSGSRSYDGWGSHYEKFVRVAHQWPIVAVAAAVKTDGGTISEARIGLVNMGSTALRATRHRAGPGRRRGHRGRRTRGVRPGRRGHQPALGPQRRRRLPQAPRHGADPTGGARRRGRLSMGMELRHEFTVPADASRRPGTPFNDIESVAACFPGATVTSVEGDTFQGSCKVKLGPIALVYNGIGHVRGEGRVGAPDGDRRQGQGQARQRHRRRPRHGDDDARRAPDQGRGAHRPDHHRQAGPVRPGRDAGRQRQAARPVHRLPGAEGGRPARQPARPSRGAAAGEARHAAPAATEPGGRRLGPRGGRTSATLDARRRRSASAPTRRATTTPSTSAPRCCRCWLKSYWKQALGVLVVLLVLRRLLRRELTSQPRSAALRRDSGRYPSARITSVLARLCHDDGGGRCRCAADGQRWRRAWST